MNSFSVKTILANNVVMLKVAYIPELRNNLEHKTRVLSSIK